MTTDQDHRYQRAMSQGHSAAWDQDWNKAAEYYKQALSQKPNDVKAVNSLALALFEMQDFEEALKVYLQAAQLAPEDPIPLEKAAALYENAQRLDLAAETSVRAAELYLKRQDVEKAIENWSRAVSLNPEHLRAHTRLAIVFEKIGRKQQAAREYLHVGSLMQHHGDIAKAVDSVNRALKIDPDNVEAQQALVMLRDGTLLPKPARPRGGTGPIRKGTGELRLAAPKEAEDSGMNPIEEAQKEALSVLAGLFFDQSLEDDSNGSTGRRGFQSIVSGTGPLFSKKVDQTKIMLHLSQAVDSQLGGDAAQAAEELKRAIDAGLDNLAAHFQLGYLRAEANRLESAVRHLQRSVQHPDFALASRLLLGEVMMKMGRLQDAAVEYMEALKVADVAVVAPKQADGLRQLYDPLVEAQMQETNEAQQKQICTSVAELLMRENWRQHLRQFRSQSMVTDDDGPPTPLAEVLTEARSSQVVVAMNNVRRLARKGQHHAAIEEAFYALEFAPTYLPLHITIGELLLSQDLIPEAIQKFLVIARSYSVRGEAGRAIDMLRRVVDLSPMDLEARNRLIDQLITRGTPSDAVEEYIKMAEVYYSLADLTNARKTYTKALRLTQISDINPNWQVRVLHRIADIDIQSLDWRQALQIYQEIVKVKPDDEKAYASLVDLNFRLSESDQAIREMDRFIQFMNAHNRTVEVIQFLEKQVEERPQEPAIHRRLAEEFYLVGNLEQAINQLDVTGDLLLNAGDRMGAMAAIQRIIEFKPPEVEKYQQLLEQLRT
ncbi:MAG: tetratricopeptide repeat protein [Anaerolineales bacterium]|jgi:tetratricopeptide (TPR) repeat protein